MIKPIITLVRRCYVKYWGVANEYCEGNRCTVFKFQYFKISDTEEKVTCADHIMLSVEMSTIIVWRWHYKATTVLLNMVTPRLSVNSKNHLFQNRAQNKYIPTRPQRVGAGDILICEYVKLLGDRLLNGLTRHQLPLPLLQGEAGLYALC